MQTVPVLHCWARLAHLNISTSSILILDNPTQPWDCVRLQDFGFCRQVGQGRCKALRPSCTASVAAESLNPLPCFSSPHCSCHQVCSAGGFNCNSVDYVSQTVKPAGVCSSFGAPEHVRSVYLLRQGGQNDAAILINGPAADMWSLGVVFYIMVS